MNWTETEDEVSLGNSHARNVIYNGIDKNVFRLINTHTLTKEAWSILRVAQEDTSKVKMSRRNY